MNNTMLLKAKVDESVKNEVEDIFDKLGLSVSDAINIFYHQVKLRKGLPFDVVIPNIATLKTFRDTDKGKNLVKCKNADDMFKKLKI